MILITLPEIVSKQPVDNVVVLERDDYRCQICGRLCKDVHHVKPRGMGGSSDPTRESSLNKISVCRACHDKVEANDWDVKLIQSGPLYEGDPLTTELVVKGRDERIWHNEKPERKAEVAHRMHQTLIKGLNLVKSTFWKLSLVVKNILDEKLYEGLGYNTAQEYFESPEIQLTYHQAMKLKRVREKYQPMIESGKVTEEEIVAIGIEKADRISKFTKHSSFEEWLEVAKTENQKDLRQLISESSNGDVPSFDGEMESERERYVNEIKTLLGNPDSVDNLKKIIALTQKRIEKKT